jgi:hypothetical protein
MKLGTIDLLGVAAKSDADCQASDVCEGIFCQLLIS